MIRGLDIGRHLIGKIMEPQLPMLEQHQEWDYNQKKRELQITRMRAVLLRKQIAEAYEKLENIRFDFLSDTAFRDKITRAKKGCEEAIGDFLLDDSYHKANLETHRNLNPKQYAEKIEGMKGAQGLPTQK